MELGDKIAKQLETHPKFQGKIDTPNTHRWRKYIARVAQPLLAEVKRKKIKYRFHVIDSPVVNAFAIPGGHIYFYTGLLENKGGTWLANEAQLAGILAHEISHIDLGHVIAVFQYLKRAGLTNPEGQKPATIAVALARHIFSSNQEDEADKNATKIMTLAQYDPAEFVAMWKQWGKNGSGKRKLPDSPIAQELLNLLQSHSAPKRRACNVNEHAAREVERRDFDRYYVGDTNFQKRKARVQKQY